LLLQPSTYTTILLTTVNGINSLMEGFPKKSIKITGLPTFETLKVPKQDLEANAASVSSILRGGQHGQLGVVLDAQTYAIIVGNDASGAPQPFIPTFPGILPVVLGNNAAAQDEDCMFSASVLTHGVNATLSLGPTKVDHNDSGRYLLEPHP
jgi:hypothetical protein